jgi:geranylgeranyl diphosphate synthase type II
LRVGTTSVESSLPSVQPKPPASSAAVLVEQVPAAKSVRDRLRALAADLVASWSGDVPPTAVKTAAGLRKQAELLVRRCQAQPEYVGWTMVAILSEYWRDRIASATSGRRLLLLPDCPHATRVDQETPAVCGPACGIGTLWAAAHDSGWVVSRTDQAVAAIGGLLTGQYQGILGVARLPDLEKAFAMLPAFSLPVAAVPYRETSLAGHPSQAEPPSCGPVLESAGIDVDWLLGLLGVAGGAPGPVADYLPLLREAAELFEQQSIVSLGCRYGLGEGFGSVVGNRAEGDADAAPNSLTVTAELAGEFLTRGGKYLRPFVTLAAYDALRVDLTNNLVRPPAAVDREAARAAAVAIEVFHKSSLIHDDIEDNDLVRYGRPTVHLEQGIPAAINIGDYLLGAGYRLIAGVAGESGLHRDLLTILSDAHLRLAQGQGAELWWRDAGDGRVTPAESLAIYGLKTSPAFEAAVAMGIRLAGLQPAEAVAVDRYALHVGTGFQVLNDLKDWHGDLENDRRIAGDLLGGRPTVMWAIACEQLAGSGHQELREIAHNCTRIDASDESRTASIQAARRLYQQAGVFERMAEIVTEQRSAAAESVRSCRYPRLREVLEFLLDLAVPEQAVEAARQPLTSPDR